LLENFKAIASLFFELLKKISNLQILNVKPLFVRLNSDDWLNANTKFNTPFCSNVLFQKHWGHFDDFTCIYANVEYMVMWSILYIGTERVK